MDFSDEIVLVTGGSGFLGSFVCEQLHEIGVETVFVPRSKDYDLTGKIGVQEMYDQFSPSVVFHLAAVVGGIGVNKDRPGDFFYKNLMMGTHLIEEARKREVKKFVAVGSSCAYPKDISVPFHEDQFWEGYPEETNAPYGLAKKMMLVQAKAYKKQHDFETIHLIPANFFGPRDDFDLYTSHVIPAMIRKIYNAWENQKNEVTFWGTGDPTRDFLFVEDAARAVVMAGQEYDDASSPVNIASGKETSIRQIAQLIKDHLNFQGKITWDDSHPDGRPRVCLDNTRAKKKFGFEASTDFVEGLNKTINWFVENKNLILEKPGISGYRGGLPDFIRDRPLHR